ncbi:DJ-1 [Coprinellus micaceus]|uniref:D-lactate dehydratase n=1 Tax=Coprinellus micaceus TaxID=71717 RepID=A0A4Y7TFG7_COPMI|nr:DJ-1 [Coprinellus micaceus]
MPSALVLLADGTEEMEFTIAYDTLVRAGVDTQSVYVPPDNGGTKAVSPPVAKGSRGINIMPDAYLDPTTCGPARYDLLVIPGGAIGAKTMSGNLVVHKLVRDFIAKGKYVGMICAGILAALSSGLPSQPLTSHPSVKEDLQVDFQYSEDPVVVSGHLVTTRGPGTTFQFALTLVELLCGKEKREEVRGPMVFPADTPW